MGVGARGLGGALGAGHRPLGAEVHRQAAVGAEAIVAAVDRGAARACRHARLAQDGHGAALGQGSFEGAQLGVDASDRLELGEHQLVVASAEPVQVEHEPAEVAVGQLARLAQEPHTPAHAPPLAEPGRTALGVLAGRRLRVGGGVGGGWGRALGRARARGLARRRIAVRRLGRGRRGGRRGVRRLLHR